MDKNVFLFEKYIVKILIFFICILLLSQIGIYKDSTRAIFTKIDEYEGVSIEQLDKMFNRGKVTLELIDIEPTDKIEILINGYDIYKFNTKEITLNINNNSIIEIDGTAISHPFKVKVKYISDNISNKCDNKEFDINSNIIIIDRFFLK